MSFLSLLSLETAAPIQLGAARQQAKSSSTEAFSTILNRKQQDADPVADVDKDAKQIRESAEQLVSSTFIMPLFKQLRNDPLASDMFHGGQGEEIFQQQMDQILSDRIAGGANFDLVDAVEDFFTQRLSMQAGPAVAGLASKQEASDG